MNRVALAVAILAASFALQHYADKKLEAKFRELLNKKAAEQNAPTNGPLTPRTQLGFEVSR